MTDVTIIIPAYNRLWSLPKAVESCKETSLNTEIIVIDDGSTDGTAAWLNEHSEITVITQSNRGKDQAVNNGLQIATGKYIRFLDSDDWLLPYSTDKLFNHSEKFKLDITCAGYQVFEDEKFVKEIKWTVCDDFLAQQLGECDSSHYSAYLFKKDFIINIPHRSEFGALDDRQFIIEAAMKQPRVGYIETPALAHRLHQHARLQSASGSEEYANHLARYQIYKNCFSRLAEYGMLTRRRKNAACNILWHLAHWVAKTDLNKAREIYEWVYKLNPEFLPKENLSVAKLYKIFGFTNAERLFRLRRLFK